MPVLGQPAFPASAIPDPTTQGSVRKNVNRLPDGKVERP